MEKENPIKEIFVSAIGSLKNVVSVDNVIGFPVKEIKELVEQIKK